MLTNSCHIPSANVFKAYNGEEAFEQVTVTNFDLVIMDLNMPVMGGLESCALIK